MKIRKKETNEKDQIELQMTPMIDIVFQLLVFFIMTFKIVAMEGDFNIKMPQASSGAPQSMEDIVQKVGLRGNADGKLVAVTWNSNRVPGGTIPEMFANLQSRVIEVVSISSGPEDNGSEVEIDADYHLQYHYVIQAITAVTGKKDADGNVITLIEKIKFSPSSGGGG